MAPPSFAFSVGDIKIKSKFGEIFDDSFEISLDHDGAYEVVLGDLSDYQKLGLIRPSLVNSLTHGETYCRQRSIKGYPYFFPKPVIFSFF